METDFDGMTSTAEKNSLGAKSGPTMVEAEETAWAVRLVLVDTVVAAD